jgi:dihydroflavonol-4-reductase
MVTVVTGGAGHLGTNLVAALRAEGREVRVVDLRRPVTAVGLGATWVPVDVRDRAGLLPAFDGADVVYHLAGVISVVGGMNGLVHSVNVGGTRAVAEAALEAGVGRLVHCSSVHAFDLRGAPGAPGGAAGVVDESNPPATRPDLPAYDRSKARGEVEVRRVVDRGLDAVVVNPTGVIGARDEAPSRMGAVMLALWRGRLPALVPGGFDWVDVRDVAAAMMAAAQWGRTGESYLLPGHRRSVVELAALARACSGVRVTSRTVPAWSLRLCAPLATALARWTASPLLPTREALHALRAYPRVDGGKAARDLGHRPRPIEQTVADLYAFLRRPG